MRLIVRPLRTRGRRLRWQQVSNAPAYEGDLLTYEIQAKGGRIIAATLTAKDPAAAKPLPDLFEPVLTAIAPAAFRLRGFERLEGPEGPYSVAQEWHCELP